jgi:hypothetical protein
MEGTSEIVYLLFDPRPQIGQQHFKLLNLQFVEKVQVAILVDPEDFLDQPDQIVFIHDQKSPPGNSSVGEDIPG